MDPGELLARVAEVLDRNSIPYFVTGSVATIAYGEPRFTNDIDIVVRLDERGAIALASAFDSAEFYLAPESIERALRERSSFNLIHPSAGLKVDFMVADDSRFNASRFQRLRSIETGLGEPIPFASPEDVIVKKLEYYREGGSQKHLRDIAGVLRTTGEIDRDYIAHWAEALGVAREWQKASELADSGA